MTCSEELLEKIKQALEETPYGKVTITNSEKGSYWEIVIERKDRVFKDSDTTLYHQG